MQHQKQEKDWGKMANKFDKTAGYVVGEAINEEIYERLSKEKNMGSVIEFGCGTGYFTEVIAKNAKQVIATDVSYDMLEMAKKQLKDYKNVSFKKADCKATNFLDNEFDTVFMANLLHVIKNPTCALEESYRILKPGGLLIAVDLTGYAMNFFDKMKMGFRYLRKIGMPPKGVKNNLSPFVLESFTVNAGFKIEENKLLGDKVKALYLKGIKKHE